MGRYRSGEVEQRVTGTSFVLYGFVFDDIIGNLCIKINLLSGHCTAFYPTMNTF